MLISLPYYFVMLYFEGNYVFFYVIYHTYINKERRKYIARCFANPPRLETDQTQDFINVNIKRSSQ